MAMFKGLSHQARANLNVLAVVLLGAVLVGGPGFIYHSWDVNRLINKFESSLADKDEAYGRQIERMEKTNKSLLDKKDDQITKLTDRFTQLTSVIEERLPVIVEQLSETVEKQDKVSSQVGVAVSQSKRAANAASKAANQAGRAVYKSRQPGGGLRVTPNKSKGPSCFLGKDVYDQPCR